MDPGLPAPSEDLRTPPLDRAVGDSPGTVEAVAGWHHAAGTHPHGRGAQVDGTVGLDDVLAAGLSVTRSYTSHAGDCALALAGDGWVAHLRSNRRTHVVAYGVTDADARRALELITSLVTAPAEGDVTVHFKHRGPHGTVTHPRPVDAPEFADIAPNYRHDARAALEQLVAMTCPDPTAGRLVLLHGPTGTGKTTAVRSLARAWAPWCDTSYILDPEVLFSDSDYLHQLLFDHHGTRHGDGPDGEQRWHLVVIEDADEIIAPDARLRADQALSRLLNLTDGILGRGLRILVLITTNEPLSALHPSATRPGRCLAEIEIGPIPRSQAVAWLPDNPFVRPPDRDLTLAELYALAADAAPIRSRNDRPVPVSYL